MITPRAKHSQVMAMLLLVTLLVLSACAAAPTTPAPAGETVAPTEPAAESVDAVEPTAASETSAESSSEGGNVTVTHVQGETTLPQNPEKVVVFDFSLLDTLDQLGIPVVGVPSGTNMPPALAQYVGEEYTNVGTLFEPDYEKVNELQPDLIMVALRSGPLYPDLSQIAPTVDLTVDGTNLIPTFKEAVTNVGLIFGKEAEVEIRLAEIDASIERVNKLATSSGQTALIVMVSGGEVTAFGPGSRFGIIHDVLGVTPISADVETETHGDAISFEYILEKDPDILFVIDRDAATGESSESAEQVLDNELVHATQAWQNDKIFYLDPAAWYLSNHGLGSMEIMISQVEAALGGESAEGTAPAEGSTEGDTVTVSHVQGETEVAKNPETVVVFDFSLLDTLDQLGIPVVGVPSGTNMPPVLAEYAGDGYTNVGTLFEPDYEKVNELQPDLIMVALRSGPLYPDLSQIAPTVDLTVDSTNLIPTFKAAVTNIGLIFGKEAEVESRLADIDASIERVNELATSTGQTALIVMVSGGEVTAFGPGSRFGLIHDVLGVTPISADVETETHGDAISFEYILEKDPDILFVIDRDAATGESSEPAAQVIDNELVHATQAWQNDKVFYLTPAAWYLSNHGLGSMETMIAEVEAALQ